MPISSLIADPTTQAEVDFRRERAYRQYSRRTHSARPARRRWLPGVGRHSDIAGQ